MKERLFRFKHFEVSHSRSAMPVGVDGVLVGAWATAEGRRVLDVGTGCGVIAMMIAQRNGKAIVDAIDIDESSVEEARENFLRSQWDDRLSAKLVSFSEVPSLPGYDLIISNPPYFDSGIRELDTARKKARHVGELSPEILVEKASHLLNPGGLLSLIVPSGMKDSLCGIAKKSGMVVERVCYVRNHEGGQEKRVMLEFRKPLCLEKVATDDIAVEESHLTMFETGNIPTSEYRALCGDFYLKF